jgi:type II secretory pathway component PulK
MIVPRQNRKARRGAAFLLLVVLVLLAVLGASQSVLQGEITHRRSEADQHRVRIMNRAIGSVALHVSELAASDSNDSMRLPVNDATEEFIEVSWDESKTKLMAQWRRGDQVLDQMTTTQAAKTIETTTEATNSESNP